MNALCILIPAAGTSSRMRGSDKLLEPVAGEPLLTRQARIASATGCTTFVTLPEHGLARRSALQGLAVTMVDVPDATEGMAASIRAGIRAVPKAARGVLILLADLPEIEVSDLAMMIGRFTDNPQIILRATAQDGTPGHPVVFPRAVFDELVQISGDSGARDVLTRHRDQVEMLALPGNRATTDLDTPEAWQEWRARTGR